MPVPESDSGRRRLFGAAILAGVLIAVGFVTVSWSRLLLTGRYSAEAGEIVLGVVSGGVLATAAFVPFLLAVLVVVAGPSLRAVVGGAVLVYAFDLLLTVGRAILTDLPGGIELTVLAVPLVRVVTFLAVATAVWLAYHGGYERLVSAAGNADHHPLFAIVADEQIGPALSLQRGLVVAGLAAIVSAGGLVLVGGIGDFLRAVARSETAGSTTIVFHQGQTLSVGISLAQLPAQWLFEASFLLAVLFVTGPWLGVRDLLKGITVVFGVQSTVTLLPVLVPPFRPVELWDTSSPVLTPLGDAILLVGIAIAVWLAFHGGLETLQHHTRWGTVSE